MSHDRLIQATHDHGRRKHVNGADATHRNPRANLEKDVERRIEALAAALDRANALMHSERAASASPSEIEAVRAEIADADWHVMHGIMQLPTGDAVQRRAFAVADRSRAVTNRIDALLRASHAKAATASDAVRGPANDMFERAELIAPHGYCDDRQTEQGVAPCQLDATTRERYRRHICSLAERAQSAWLTAISDLGIEEKFKKEETTFEAKLGELLLDTLFAVVGAGIGDAVGVAIGATARKLSPEFEVYGTKIVEEPSKATLGSFTRAAKWGAKTGLTGGENQLKGTSPQQFATDARPAVPADVGAFLKQLRNLPVEWTTNITNNVDRLLDADLAALVVGLPDPASLTPAYFERRMQALLERFRQQVLDVKSSMPPVVVVTPRGTRYALVAPEKGPDPELHGEWANAYVQTGRWTFVRWIDEDMKDMAFARDSRADRTTLVASVSDGTFWDAASMQQMSSDLAAQESQP